MADYHAFQAAMSKRQPIGSIPNWAARARINEGAPYAGRDCQLLIDRNDVHLSRIPPPRLESSSEIGWLGGRPIVECPVMHRHQRSGPMSLNAFSTSSGSLWFGSMNHLGS